MQSSTLGRTVLLAITLELVVNGAVVRAADDPSQRAALLFDEGVLRFQQADYTGSTRAFLSADAIIPNPEALENALTAARRADDPVLIARAADRALQRLDIDADVAAAARSALVDTLQRVAVIHVRCAPAPCSIELDGAPVPSGTQYALPGPHTLVSEGPGGTRAIERLNCVSAAIYEVDLQLTAPASAAGPLMPAGAQARPPLDGAPVRSTHDPRVAGAESEKPLHPLVFVAGCAGTAVLAALVTWSGLEALAAERLPPDSYDRDEVRRLQRQTDYLLLGSVVLGVATSAAGLWLVDWHPNMRAQVAVQPGRSLSLTTQGRF